MPPHPAAEQLDISPALPCALRRVASPGGRGGSRGLVNRSANAFLHYDPPPCARAYIYDPPPAREQMDPGTLIRNAPPAG